VLEGTEGKGCVVPHDDTVRTKLLREMQTRFEGIDNRKVISEMLGEIMRAAPGVESYSLETG
jgi:hypothetical protein